MSHGNQRSVQQMDIATGRFAREDNSFANLASVLSPKPHGFEKLTIDGTATPLTAATYAGAMTAVVCVENAGMRYRVDGVAPTTDTGIPMASGDVFYLQSPEAIAGFLGIAVTATDSVLQIAYDK